MFGKRKDVVFKQLKALLDPFGIARYYTDDWGAYERHLDAGLHEVGKRNTQKIERKNLNLRTWVKRLARKTICFSKDETMHDTVIGLLINKVEFGIDIHAKIQVWPTTTSYSDSNDHCEPWASRRINVDLNRGAGGQYIYLCIYRSPGYKPVTGLAIVGYKCPDGYQKINIDLNSGARVDKKITSAIYLCVAHNQDYYPYHYFGSPITSIEVTAHPTSSRNICKNPYRLEYDLNYSVGGDYIYICYDRDRSGYW